MRIAHVPIRTCVGCRRRRPQGELIKLKAQDSTAVVTSPRDQRPGRGCYVCPNIQCVEAATKKGAIARALRKDIAVIPSKEGLLRWLAQKGMLDGIVDR
jgi:uncharacterized protein